MAAEAPVPTEGGASQEQALQAMKAIEDALMNLQKAVESAGAPPEAMEALNAAAAAYGEFLSIATGQVEAAPQKGAQSPEMAMGAKGAMPADQAQGPGARAIPA